MASCSDQNVEEEDQRESSLIVKGVIEGVKQAFVDSGVDLDVLYKLENMWVSKLDASKASGLHVADIELPDSVKNLKPSSKLTNISSGNALFLLISCCKSSIY